MAGIVFPKCFLHSVLFHNSSKMNIDLKSVIAGFSMMSLGIGIFFALPRLDKIHADNTKKPQIDAYAKGYQDGIYEGIKRAQAQEKSDLPLPVSDEPGCDITPEKPRVNYLERLKTK
jgi:hypothetical protein